MGFKLAEWAQSVEAVKGWTKAVFVILAMRADDKSGECFPSQKTLAAASGASVATVNRSLDQLEAIGIITRTRRASSSGYRTSDLIRIDRAWISESQLGTPPTRQTANLADSNSLDITLQTPTYQGDSAEEDQTDGQSDGQSELLIIEPTPPARSFAEFWTVWPRKVSKPQAERAWKAATKRASPEVIYAGAVAYAMNPHIPAKEFIPHASTWLTGDRWNDELPGPRQANQRLTPAERNLAFTRQLAARQAAESRGLTA